ncbi:4Fe-4S dicluster domain-containing protein [Pirellulaceae bacterium SH449]
MAHVVTEACLDCKHAECVAVCPSNSFREGERMMFIDPEQCIDCEACVAACPVDAIFHEDDLLAEWLPYRDLNATMARQSPAALPTLTNPKNFKN